MLVKFVLIFFSLGVCNADRITIDSINITTTAAGGAVSISFSSDPNARFRCRLRNQRNMQCKLSADYFSV